VIDFSRYKSIVFIDSMVVLHGQPLDRQPWKEIDPIGPILVLIVPQVQTEIDKRKLDGRLSTRARAFNRLIRPSVLKGGDAIQIVSGPPVVDLGMAFPRPIPWEKQRPTLRRGMVAWWLVGHRHRHGYEHGLTGGDLKKSTGIGTPPATLADSPSA